MFDAKRFLQDFFQTPAGLVAHFVAAGLEPPTEAAVEKWFQRNNIPGAQLTRILSLLEVERGAPVSLAPYEGRK